MEFVISFFGDSPSLPRYSINLWSFLVTAMAHHPVISSLPFPGFSFSISRWRKWQEYLMEDTSVRREYVRVASTAINSFLFLYRNNRGNNRVVHVYICQYSCRKLLRLSLNALVSNPLWNCFSVYIFFKYEQCTTCLSQKTCQLLLILTVNFHIPFWTLSLHLPHTHISCNATSLTWLSKHAC